MVYRFRCDQIDTDWKQMRAFAPAGRNDSCPYGSVASSSIVTGAGSANPKVEP